MHREEFKKFTGASFIVRVNFQPGVDERANQPRPDRALMVSAVPRTQIAGINRLVFRIIGRKRPQSEWGEQFVLDDIDNGPPAFLIEHRMIERDGKDLIWTARNIVGFLLAVAIDNVEKITAIGEPKTLVERSTRPLWMFLITLRSRGTAGSVQPIREQLKRVIPEGIYLDWLAAAWRHDPIIHLRIHPSKLITFFAFREQTVGRIDMNIELRSTQVLLDNVYQSGQEKLQRRAIIRYVDITGERMKEPERRVSGVIKTLLRAIGKHVRDQTVTNVVGEGSQDVSSFEPATGR